MTILICRSTVCARKKHLCDHCQKMIDIGEMYSRMALKLDTVYTLRAHRDCEEAATAIHMLPEWRDADIDFELPDGGYPVLCCTGYFEYFPHFIDKFRETFPAVAARIAPLIARAEAPYLDKKESENDRHK